LHFLQYVFTFGRRYEREVERCAPNPVPPEFRLEMAMIAAPLYAISFFWFAWTSYPSISLWAPLMSGLLNGFGISWIFVSFGLSIETFQMNSIHLFQLSLFNYIIDTYLKTAASALAANTVIRSLFGAAFPVSCVLTSLIPFTHSENIVVRSSDV
jgi:hypothetical protein